MSTSILVAYATKSGSTKEAAEAVAAELRQSGLAVELKPLRDVQTLTNYHAVIVGAPLYMFRWHKDAKRFLRQHRTVLSERPVAVFALGPINDKEEEWQGAREQLAKELAPFDWFNPIATTIFGGRFDPATLRFPFTWIPALKKLPASDIRDWEAIRAWANGLAEQLQPVMA